METLRTTAYAAPDDDLGIVGDKLSAKQEAFAQAWAETNNQAAAYRRVYNVGERTKPECIWAAAGRLAGTPNIRARFNELRELSLLETLCSVRELFQMYLDIATADPNEIVRVRQYCCRNCYGESYAYQWRDVDEWVAAVDAPPAKGRIVASDAGGFGFDPFLEPHPACPHCMGAGIEKVMVADTTKLTGKAKRLYKGAKQDRYGCIEVMLHDQDNAREMIGKMLAAFTEKVDLRTPNQRANEEARHKVPDNITEAEASKLYLARLAH